MNKARSNDPESCLPLHTIEFRVLLVLLGGDLHGYAIAKEIERRDSSLGEIFPTNLYRRLRDMTRNGLIDQRPTPSNGDKRRQFRITKFGRLVAKEEAGRLESLVLDARRHDLLSSQPVDR